MKPENRLRVYAKLGELYVYREELLEEITKGSVEDEYGSGISDASDGESDPLYDQAVQLVTESRRASVSGVQRRLKVGYNRASRLVEAMEAAGVVTAMQPNGSREVIAPPTRD